MCACHDLPLPCPSCRLAHRVKIECRRVPWLAAFFLFDSAGKGAAHAHLRHLTLVAAEEMLSFFFVLDSAETGAARAYLRHLTFVAAEEMLFFFIRSCARVPCPVSSLTFVSTCSPGDN